MSSAFHPAITENKPRFARALALTVASALCRELKPHCERLVVAGSLRRRKETVGDIEILYIPKTAPGARTDMFAAPDEIDCTSAFLDKLIERGIITKRLNKDNHATWGPKNKLARHFPSLIPVDFFTATEANWYNYLVCRTGGMESNIRIAEAAQAKGWKWNPYGPGFTDDHGDIVPSTTERQAFELVGLPYLEPWERNNA